MVKIIAVANQKGGVAKTTTAYNLGDALCIKNKRVLMIDMDSQSSLTISVGLEPLEIENNIISILKKDAINIKDCIHKLKSNLHIITSIIDLAGMEVEMMSRAGRERILYRALQSIKTEYDYIIIDCPPQLSILTINALSCADGVVIPVKTDYLAYRGLTQLNDTIIEIQEIINPKLKIIGVIATMFEKRIKDDIEILDALTKNYNLLGIVKKLAIAKKGIYDGISVVEQYPKSEISIEYMNIADIIVKEMGKNV